MLKFVVVVFAINCAILAMGSIARYPVSTHPDHPGKCWFDEDKKAYAVEEKWSNPDNCGEFTCNDDFSVIYVTCGAIGAGPGYTISKVDLSKPYPKCCPQAIKE